MNMMIPITISPGATTAAVRLIVFGNAAPIIPPPAATSHQKERPQQLREQSAPLLIRILKVRDRLDDVLLQLRGDPPRDASISSSDPVRHKSALQLDDPAMLRADPRLSAEALSPPK